MCLIHQVTEYGDGNRLQISKILIYFTVCPSLSEQSFNTSSEFPALVILTIHFLKAKVIQFITSNRTK
jgi:hypothetical protein